MELGDLQLSPDAHKLVVDRVLRANIGLLYQHLDPSGDLPALRPYVTDEDNTLVDMYQQKQAKLLMLYACLLKSNATTKPLDLQLVCSELSGREFVEPEMMLGMFVSVQQTVRFRYYFIFAQTINMQSC